MVRTGTEAATTVSDQHDSANRRRSLEGFLRTGYLIHDVSRLRRQLYDQRSRHLGITRAQWWVLFNLGRKAGTPMNQNELAQMLEMGSASTGELLRRLEKSGFIRRHAVPGDRRSKHVLIAERGLEVLRNMRHVARSSNDTVMAGISDQEQVLLNDLLSRMKVNLQAEIALSPEPAADEEDPSVPPARARGKPPKRVPRGPEAVATAELIEP